MQAPDLLQGSKQFDPVFSQGRFKNKVTLSQEHLQIFFRITLKLTPGHSSWHTCTQAGEIHQALKITREPEWPLYTDPSLQPFLLEGN